MFYSLISTAMMVEMTTFKFQPPLGVDRILRSFQKEINISAGDSKLVYCKSEPDGFTNIQVKKNGLAGRSGRERDTA